MMGKSYFFRSNSENKNKKFRRSIYAVKDIKKGKKLTSDNIKIIRPGYGLSPFFYYKIINKKSPFDIKSETPIKSSLLKIFKIKNRIL
jgi:sialic acid synthase SpsE